MLSPIIILFLLLSFCSLSAQTEYQCMVIIIHFFCWTYHLWSLFSPTLLLDPPWIFSPQRRSSSRNVHSWRVLWMEFRLKLWWISSLEFLQHRRRDHKLQARSLGSVFASLSSFVEVIGRDVYITEWRMRRQPHFRWSIFEVFDDRSHSHWSSLQRSVYTHGDVF
jgi:hypothetical protein